MDFLQDSIKPIYIQIAEWIEDEILKGNIQEEEQVLSKNQFAMLYKVNPATANKGINILVDENILYKKRGIGMFVSTGAKEMITKKRKENFCVEYIDKLLFEAEKLGISKGEIIEILKKR
jgi:DNA-binding transcriptional regulator YhcF (GntR family)